MAVCDKGKDYDWVFSLGLTVYNKVRLLVSAVFAIPYSTYYKHMGDLPYISSEQGGWACNTYWACIRIYTSSIYARILSWRGGWAYNTSWGYSKYYTGSSVVCPVFMATYMTASCLSLWKVCVHLLCNSTASLKHLCGVSCSDLSLYCDVLTSNRSG